MTRVGLFTGKVYDSSVPSGQIKECCVMIDAKKDDEFVNEYASKQTPSERCLECYACEEAQKALKSQN